MIYCHSDFTAKVIHKVWGKRWSSRDLLFIRRRLSLFSMSSEDTNNVIKLTTVHQFTKYCFYCEPQHDKTNKMCVRSAKTQVSLGRCPVRLCAPWVAKDPRFLHAESEGSDQTGRMPRLIWVFAGCTGHFVGFVVRRITLFLQLKYIIKSPLTYFLLLYMERLLLFIDIHYSFKPFYHVINDIVTSVVFYLYYHCSVYIKVKSPSTSGRPQFFHNFSF